MQRNLQFPAYRRAVSEGFTVNMYNPTLFWNLSDGFYVAPSRDLVPNRSPEIGRFSYDANTGNPSMTGSRREYVIVRSAIVAYLSRPVGERGSFSDQLDEARNDARPDERRRV